MTRPIQTHSGPSTSTPNKIVFELIGPSGVGKSFFSSHLLKRLSSRLSDGSRTEIPNGNHHQATPLPHWRLLELKVQELAGKDSLTVLQKTLLMQHFTFILLQDIAMLSLSPGETVLLDEGVLHNFAGEILCSDSSDTRAILQSKAIVYLRPNRTETILKRVLARARAGELRSHHIGMTHREMLEAIEHSVEKFDRFVGLADRYGVPSLTLAAEASTKQKTKLFEEFEGVCMGRLFRSPDHI